jgi:hypothetical protein
MASDLRPLHQSFIAGRSRHAIVPALLAAGCVIAYVLQPRNQQPNGGTWLGYALGTIAALLILVLMGYGIRRRVFGAKVGNAAGWLSIHVYFGLCTLVVASLHCGFHFGRNIHTIAYALMCLVVASGCWGVYAYLRYPALLVRTRGNSSREQLLRQISDFDKQALSLAGSLNAALREFVIDAIRRTRIGGGLWAQLTARDESALLLAPPLHPGLATVVSNAGQRVFIDVLSRHATGGNQETRETLEKLLKVAGQKAVVQRKLQRDLQLQGLMQFWLYLHLPLSFGLLMALAIHIFAVFFYL